MPTIGNGLLAHLGIWNEQYGLVFERCFQNRFCKGGILGEIPQGAIDREFAAGKLEKRIAENIY